MGTFNFGLAHLLLNDHAVVLKLVYFVLLQIGHEKVANCKVSGKRLVVCPIEVLHRVRVSDQVVKVLVGELVFLLDLIPELARRCLELHELSVVVHAEGLSCALNVSKIGDVRLVLREKFNLNGFHYKFGLANLEQPVSVRAHLVKHLPLQPVRDSVELRADLHAVLVDLGHFIKASLFVRFLLIHIIARRDRALGLNLVSCLHERGNFLMNEVDPVVED